MDSLKTLIFGVVTFTIGGIVGYKICEKHLAEAYREDLEDAIQRNKKYDMEVGKNVDSQEDPDDAVVLFKRKKDEKDEEERKIDYTKFIKPNIFVYADEMQADEDKEETDDESEEDFEDEAEDEDEEDIENDEYEKQPIVLMEEYYYELLDSGAEGQMLFYYSKDGVVCEEDDTIVDHHNVLLGNEFEDVLYDNDIVWVRNPDLDTIYEIHKIDSSYLEDVTNAVETPRERSFRHAGRIKKAVDGE